MQGHEWEQVKTLLHDALAQPAAARTDWLAQQPATPAVRQMVTALLTDEAQLDTFLATPYWQPPPALTPQDQTIGPYRLRKEIGRGGMGVVYLAERADDLYHKQVAVKLVFPSFESSEAQQRFHRERHVLGKLDHPNIVRIIDGGQTPHGWAYLVMDYIAGAPLTAYCQQHALTLEARLHLFQQVCHAVEAAHQQQILHRDLKPANILVTVEGTPKLLDFGIAKLLEGDPAIWRTRSALHFLTPEYASPEILRGEPGTLASDVYSLGVLLYELLTGQHPFVFPTGALAEVLHIVTYQEPRRPSLALAAAPTDFWPITAAQLRGDLDKILLRALCPDATRRYATVTALREDLTRLLQHQPVTARTPTLRYRLQRWTQRHPVGATLTVLSVFLLIFVSVGGWVAARRARIQAWQEYQRRYAAQMREAGNDLTNGNFSRLRTTLENFQPLAGAPEVRGFEWQYLWQQSHQEKLRLPHAGWVYAVTYSPDGKWLATACQDGTATIWDAATGAQVRVIQAHQRPVGSVQFSPDSQLLATASEFPEEMKLWDVATGAPRGRSSDGLRALTFSAQGQWLATARHIGLGVYRAPSLQIAWEHALPAQVLALTTTADQQHLITARDDGVVTTWQLATGQLRHTFKAHDGWVFAVALSPDEQYLATGGGDKVASLWERKSGRLLARFMGHQSAVRAVAFTPNGQQLLTASADRTIKLWDLHTYQLLYTWRGHEDRIRALSIAPDGQTFATCSDDGTARIWRLPPPISHWARHQARIFKLALAPDGQTLASVGSDHTIRRWNINQLRPQPVIPGVASEMYSVAFAPEGGEFATANEDQTVQRWDSQTGAPLATLRPQSSYPAGLWDRAEEGLALWLNNAQEITLVTLATQRTLRTFRLGGQPIVRYDVDLNKEWVAAASATRHVTVWQAQTGQAWLQLRAPGVQVRGLGFSENGNYLYVLCNPHTVQLWDLRQRRLVRTSHQDVAFGWFIIASKDERFRLERDGTKVWLDSQGERRQLLSQGLPEMTTGLFTADGQHFLIGNKQGKMQYWQAQPLQLLATWQAGDGYIYKIIFLPDGQTVAVACADGQVRVFALPDGQLRHCFAGHNLPVGDITVSADERYLYTSGYDGVINGWELATGKSILHEQQLIAQGNALSVAYAPNGQLLAAGYERATVLWERPSYRVRAILKGHTESVWGVQFSPDSRLLATASWDHTVKLWDTATGQERARLTAHTAAVTAVAFAPNGKLLATGSHDHTVKLWDTATGQCVRTLSGAGDQVLTVAFTPDGSRIAAAGADKVIRLYDVATGEELLALPGHTDEIWSLAFAPDGHTLYSGSWDHTIRLWTTAPTP